MQYKFKSLLFLCLLVIVSSCSDDLLEEVNPNGVSADIFWSNLDETESSLNGVYAAMLHTYLHNMPAEVLRGDAGFPRRRQNTNGRGVPFYQQTFTNSLREVEFKWEACYQLILRANQVISGLESLETADSTSQVRWTTQMAQARFFRGLGHFYLHSSYNNGSIIIKDALPVSIEDFNKPLSSSAEVIDFFRKDLVYAYENLPYSYSNAELGRVTKGAAATILATSHLYEEEYSDAMVYASDVITNPEYGYELVAPDMLFNAGNEFNKESIFEVNYTVDVQPEDTQWDEESFNTRLARYTAPNNLGGGGAEHIIPTAWISYAYATETMDTQDPRNTIDTMGGTRLRNVPMRASAMVALVQDVDTEYYLFPSVPEACSFAGLSFSFFKKHTNHDIAAREHETGATPWKSGKNLMLNRLAEVYLIMAECQIQGGDIDGALESINTIRKRWGLQLLGPSDGTAHDFDGVTYSKASLMDHLMFVERPLELACEGNALRVIDLRRWGIQKTRYEELSKMEFYVENYDYVKGDGSSAKRNNSLLQAGTPPGNETVILEFQESPNNFVESLHAYFPIPLSEVQNNSSID